MQNGWYFIIGVWFAFFGLVLLAFVFGFPEEDRSKGWKIAELLVGFAALISAALFLFLFYSSL